MEIVLLLIGVVVGFAIGFLLSKSQKPKSEIDSSAWDKKISSLETETKFLSAEKERILNDFEKQKSETAKEFREEKDRLLKELKEEQAKFLEASTSLEKS